MREKLCLEREKTCLDSNSSLKSSVDSLQRNVTLLDSTNSTCRKHGDSLQSLNKDLNDELSTLSSKVLSQKQLLDAALQRKQAEIEKKEKHIQEMRQVLKKQEDVMNNLLSTIKNAVNQYDANDLTVNLRDGKVYVAISDKLLFKSGSAKVDDKGKEALGKLAKVLHEHPDLDIVVEGHTDSIPIKTERFFDNWDLSVIRSTSVVRILCADFGISPKQITPAGRGEYFPKAPNNNPENRALNRRTEIIIAPKLNELFTAIATFE